MRRGLAKSYRSLGLAAAVLLLVMPLMAHEFYLSICQVKYKPGDKAIRVSARLFINDLEDTIADSSGLRLMLNTDRQSAESDRRVFDYLRQKIGLKVNGRLLEARWVRLNFDYDAAICELEYPLDNRQKAVEIENIYIGNRILLEKFDGQNNIVRLNIAGQKRTLQMDKRITSEMISF